MNRRSTARSQNSYAFKGHQRIEYVPHLREGPFTKPKNFPNTVKVFWELGNERESAMKKSTIDLLNHSQSGTLAEVMLSLSTHRWLIQPFRLDGRPAQRIRHSARPTLREHTVLLPGPAYPIWQRQPTIDREAQAHWR